MCSSYTSMPGTPSCQKCATRAAIDIAQIATVSNVVHDGGGGPGALGKFSAMRHRNIACGEAQIISPRFLYWQRLEGGSTIPLRILPRVLENSEEEGWDFQSALVRRHCPVRWV